MFGLDLIVYTPKRLKERVDMGDWFLRNVLKQGKVLYVAHQGGNTDRPAIPAKVVSRFLKL